MNTCLECSTPITASTRGEAKRFCCKACRKAFNNRRQVRGALLYDLFYAHRSERATKGLWNEMCRLHIRWRDEDRGRKTYKAPAVALADIESMDRPPITNLYERA